MSSVKTRRFRAAVAVSALLGIGVAPSGANPGTQSYLRECGPYDLTAATRTCTYTFESSDTIDTFVVPPGVGPMRITAVGGAGYGEPTWSHGAEVTSSFNFLSGTILYVVVGGDGYYGGYNGGGYGGGGASDVRVGVPDLKHRFIVAGGGGGAGEELTFDQEKGIQKFIVVQGGDAGQPGSASGGRPGTATDGGAGGGNGPGRGEAGIYGHGGRPSSSGPGGGGGGGGLFGGGGGGGCFGGDGSKSICTESQPGSGGGGSSLVPPGGTFKLSRTRDSGVTITVNEKISDTLY